MREPIIPTRSRARIAADNREELEGWIDERVEALIAGGLAPDEARRRALEEFGDIGAASQYAERQDVVADRRVRVAMWIEELSSDLRIAARTLARTPTLTAVVLLTFAFGVGATTSVFSVVHAMLLRPLPYGDEASLVYLPAVDNGEIRSGLSGGRHGAAMVVAMRERTSSFAEIASIEVGNTVVSEGGDPEQVMIATMSGNTFDVLRARAGIGRTFDPGEESGGASNVVVLLDGFWRRRFGADSSIVGRTIGMSGGARRVIGIMPPGFRVPTYEAVDVLGPRSLDGLLSSPNGAQVRVFRLFARLKAGVTTEAAAADVSRAMYALRTEQPRWYSGIDTRVLPIRTAVAGEARPRLLVLMGASAFVLLIACANVAGLLFARAIARRHELSVRVALGAGRRRLIRQFLAEGAVLATFGAGLGLVVAQLGIGALRHVAATTLPAGTTFALEPRVLSFAIVATFAVAIAASLVPAVGGTRGVGIAFRRDDARASASRASARLRLGLVAAQLAVSVVLLVGAGLFVRTLARLAAVDLGYSTEHALTFRVPFVRPKSDAEQDAFWTSLYEQLRAIPSVVSVGGGNVPTSGQSSVFGLAIEGRPVESARLPEARYSPASDDYFRALAIPVVRGRVFNAGDRDSAPNVAVVSASLAQQLWPGADPIGARVKPAPEKSWFTVVGIVGDVRMGGADAARPSVYTSQRQDHRPGGGTVIIRASGDPLLFAASVRQVVKRVDPTLPIVELRTLENLRQSTPAIADRRMQMQLMAVFALVALLVSAIGVYGVSAYAAEARRREFGIRIALGASRPSVLWLALREGAQIATLGAVVGVPLALLLASRIRGLLFEVAPFDPPTLVTTLGALVVVVLASSLVPARRATLVDPANTMRTE